MKLTSQIPCPPMTRQGRLRQWFLDNGKTQTQLADFSGVSGKAVSCWMRAERLSIWRVNQMREFGIPEELLPRAENISPGPQPGRSFHKDEFARA